MAENMDEYFAIDERAPAPMPTPPKSESGFFEGITESVSKIPEAAVRFVDIWNRTDADKGDQLARALRAGFSEDYYQELKQQRVNASRMAELQLQDMENRVQQNAFSLEQKKRLAPIVEKDAELSLQNKQLSLDQKKQLMPEQLKEQRAVTQMRLLQLQQAQYKAWDDEAVKREKIIDDQMKQRFGYSLMNDAGRAVYDNSMARKAFDEISLIMSAVKNNPEQAKYYAEKTGWKYSLNGDNVDTLTSPDGKMVFTANEEGMRKLMDNIQKTLMDDITAARITGTDAQDFATGAAKVVLNNPQFKKIYGSEGNVFRAYSNFVNKKVMDKKTGEMKDLFTPSQKTTHALSVCLNSAFQDDFFSDAEKGAIAPLLVPTLKQKGAEVRWGKGVDDTFVVVRSGGMVNTMPIKEFAQRLSQDDVISQFWNDHVMTVAQKMKANKNNASTEVEQRDMERKVYLMYGDSFSSASPAQREKIFEAAGAVAAEESDLLKKQNKTSRRQLSIDDLQRLDTMYTNITGDEKKFYSPYRDEILIRELAQLEDIKKNLMQAKKTLPGKEKETLLPVMALGYTKDEMNRKSWHSRVREIEKQIENRKKELAAHGVNTEGK